MAMVTKQTIASLAYTRRRQRLAMENRQKNVFQILKHIDNIEKGKGLELVKHQSKKTGLHQS
jgi:hypothetical protein